MTEKSSIQIFLAYAEEDREDVYELYEKLESKDYKPWLAPKDLKAGQIWPERISQAIRESSIFIACFSETSVKKQGYVQKELRQALNLMAGMPVGQIYFIPLKLNNCELPELLIPNIGYSLPDIHYIDYWTEDGFDLLLNSIQEQFPQKIDTSSLIPPIIQKIIAATNAGDFCYIFSSQFNHKEELLKDFKNELNSKPDEIIYKMVSQINFKSFLNKNTKYSLNDLDKDPRGLIKNNSDKKIFFILDFFEAEDNNSSLEKKIEYRKKVWLSLQLMYKKKRNQEYKNVSLVFLDTLPKSTETVNSNFENIILGWKISVQNSLYPKGEPITGLSAHLKREKNIHDWILSWTNGHPYLIQQLCQLVCSPEYQTNPNQKESNYIDELVKSEIIQPLTNRG
ncbi:toll/interleukin-1 receptor domain-containing protein [Gloeothece verrucosa]|uniref:TIR domain-containing protein n=1 Tax=Gloeothece verrucosa (strain PCC 7822) TaxID=497965 RepID=E0UNU8_GLOV7|nr:toll/interleukin-1 receptor domain-containing protein [Gloeothece verrucosa]ADN18628.1 hypothetical protein Cyan7822_6680 [Gloeothece verrucosa PCC 7822]